MEKIKNRRKNILFRLCIYIEVISSTILGSFLCGTSYIGILENIAISITGIMVFVYYYGLRGGRMVRTVSSQKAFLISFAVSNILVAFTSVKDIGTIWLVAVAVVAVTDSMGHAVSCHLLLAMQYLILSADAALNTKIVIFYAVLGILLALVISEVKKRRLFIYAAVIFISLTLVLAMVLSVGNPEEIWDKKGFLARCITGDIMLLVVSWFTYCIKRKNSKNLKNYTKVHEDKNALAGLGSTSHELMQRIKGYSEALYIHSIRTGNLAYRAAEFAGYNKELARAGGFYHEAGRIYEDEDYGEACNQLAKEYGFPVQLKDIMKQHCALSKTPVSPEAVVVMLSDSIISADEYFERTGKRGQITDEKLIKGIFNSRVAKAKLGSPGVDKEQIEKLMDFYINNAFKEEIKEEHYL